MQTVLTPDSAALLNYLRITLGSRREEILLGFFADPEGRLLSEATLAIGDGHSVSTSPTALMRAAINFNATKILLAHNHPSGMAFASHADVSALKALDLCSEALGVAIIDQLIVTRSEIYSMRRRRRL